RWGLVERSDGLVVQVADYRSQTRFCSAVFFQRTAVFSHFDKRHQIFRDHYKGPRMLVLNLLSSMACTYIARLPRSSNRLRDLATQSRSRVVCSDWQSESQIQNPMAVMAGALRIITTIHTDPLWHQIRSLRNTVADRRRRYGRGLSCS